MPDVTYHTAGGSRIAATLVLPDTAAGPVPAVLLCQGLSGIRSLVMPEIQEMFRAAGFASLACDYRGYGQSEGEPGWILPQSRIEDAMHGFAYLAQRPEVDPRRLGVYGLSLGGPVAVCVAADELRARAVVSVSGPPCGECMMRALRTSSEWVAFKARMLADRAQRATTGRSTLVDLAEILPFSAQMAAQYQALKSAEHAAGRAPAPPAAPPRYWFASAEAIVRWHPEEFVHRIAPRPLLLIHGENDDVATVEMARDLYARAGPSARLVIVPGYAHVDLDIGPGRNYQVQMAIDWFREHLRPPDQPPADTT
jgi:dipeptidyl aminopeptidase/acylaminoacyl peptidase